MDWITTNSDEISTTFIRLLNKLLKKIFKTKLKDV
jgi:hypothetical protein